MLAKISYTYWTLSHLVQCPVLSQSGTLVSHQGPALPHPIQELPVPFFTVFFFRKGTPPIALKYCVLFSSLLAYIFVHAFLGAYTKDVDNGCTLMPYTYNENPTNNFS